MSYVINHPFQSHVLDPETRHDLRNLIACLALDVEYLSGCSESRLDCCPCCRAKRPAATRSIRSVERIRALLLNAQSPAFITADPSVIGNYRASQSPIPIREIIMEVIEALVPAIPQGMRIALNVSADILVRANPMDVFRILFNILHNAVHVAVRSDEKFNVRITGSMTDRCSSIMISDSGPGLPTAVQNSFGLSVKAPHDRRTRGQGLLIAKRLAEINGGRVQIATCSAAGTTFEILLPSELKSSASSAPTAGADPHHGVE